VAADYIAAGLRIDVDTLRGTKIGVPNLVSILGEQGIKATFFFSVGPDNMGRNLWRLFRPSFFLKMLRSKAANLYGLDILFKGTLWPGPVIGKRAASQIRMAAAEHEIGLHAWDHYREQTSIEKMSDEEIYRFISHGKQSLEALIGRPVSCMAAPSWKATGNVLKIKEKFDFLYNSDCRGHSIFSPVAGPHVLGQPQIPTTLPTYDEIIGKDGITADNYNDYLLGLFRPEKLNVLTIHAEAEGIACKEMFADFLEKAKTKGICFLPLGRLLEDCHKITNDHIQRGAVPGREGWVACQRIDSEER
jgi:undecaprenyl phosphate-alpha-L-ara4FN deformylase